MCTLPLNGYWPKLYIPVDLKISAELTVEAVEQVMKAVIKSMESWIDDEINSSVKVRDLLVGRFWSTIKTQADSSRSRWIFAII
jgi:hypothetical protein